MQLKIGSVVLTVVTLLLLVLRGAASGIPMSSVSVSVFSNSGGCSGVASTYTVNSKCTPLGPKYGISLTCQSFDQCATAEIFKEGADCIPSSETEVVQLPCGFDGCINQVESYQCNISTVSTLSCQYCKYFCQTKEIIPVNECKNRDSYDIKLNGTYAPCDLVHYRQYVAKQPKAKPCGAPYFFGSPAHQQFLTKGQCMQLTPTLSIMTSCITAGQVEGMTELPDEIKEKLAQFLAE